MQKQFPRSRVYCSTIKADSIYINYPNNETGKEGNNVFKLTSTVSIASFEGIACKTLQQ